jgi:hypothetical protein
MSINLTKIEQKAPELISLAKKAQVSLNKYNLVDTKAKVALVLDYSGSMNRQYKSGAMQKLSEEVLALGAQLDDDGEIDLFIFHSGSLHLGGINLDNYKGSIDRLTKGHRMGTTNYAAAFNTVRDHYGFSGSLGTATVEKKGFFGKKKVVTPAPNAAPANEPVFAIFLTDGAPDSKPAAVKALTEASTAPIFWKFLSIGNESMDFLQKLDDLDDRFVDNADYKPVGNLENLTPERLFDMLLDEYPGWIKEVRAKGLIR